MCDEVCKNCVYYNFKSSTNKAWGECARPVKERIMRIALHHVSEIHNHPDAQKLLDDIDKYARIYFSEDEFGCSSFELDKKGQVDV